MGLGDEVVLPAYAAKHPTVLQLIGHACAEQGHGESRIDEACITALQTLEFLFTVQLVDIADAGHGKALPFAVIQLAQTPVEAFRAEEETTMQHHAALRAAETGLQVGLRLRVAQISRDSATVRQM